MTAKKKKSTKERSDKYEAKLKVNASFEDLVKLSVASKKEEKKK